MKPLKKIVVCILALILFALPAAADPQPMGYLDYTDDILPDGSPIYYFPEMSLTLPAQWQGKVMALREVSGTAFYQKASYNKYQEMGITGGGFLFRLGVSVNGSFSELPAFRYLGFSEESVLNYFLVLPTDYPAYPEAEISAEYDAMYAQINEVVDGVSFYSQLPEVDPSETGQPGIGLPEQGSFVNTQPGEDTFVDGQPVDLQPGGGQPGEILPGDGTPEEVITDDGMPEEVLTDDGMPEEVLTDDGMPEEVLTDDGMPEEVQADDGIPEEVMTDDAQPEETQPEDSPVSGSAGPVMSASQARYQFEHRMMPQYFYDRPNSVMDGIREVGLYWLWESVCTENGIDPTYPVEEYKENWYSCDDGTQIVQIELPEPDATTLCYRIYFVCNAETGTAGYYTVEYDDFLGEAAILCGWTPEHEHIEYGGASILDRNDEDYEEQLLAEAEQVAQLAGCSGALVPEDPALVSGGSPDEGSDDSSDASDGSSDDSTDKADGSSDDSTDKADDNSDDSTDKADDSSDDSSDKADDSSDDTTDKADDSSDDSSDDFNEDGLALISCPELGFTVKADPAYAWDYEDGTGISIYTEHQGTIPYVIVWRSEDLIVEAFEYIKEQYTPHMQEQYGADLTDYAEYEAYEIGGRQFPAGVYTYQVQGTPVEMIRIYDSTGDRTVAYTAKYIKDQGEATLEALDTAIRTFNAE